MIYETKQIQLKNGQTAILRSPNINDAKALLHHLKRTASETPYLMRYEEECLINEEMLEREVIFLENKRKSLVDMMILCEIEGEIVATCEISFNTRIKTRHRSRVGIAVIKKCWGLGIGTTMFNEMIAIAKKQGVKQIELEYIEGNERGRALYEKMGFKEVGSYPDAIQLKDGTMLKEILMMKKLYD